MFAERKDTWLESVLVDIALRFGGALPHLHSTIVQQQIVLSLSKLLKNLKKMTLSSPAI
jgi:hypothetical protein